MAPKAKVSGGRGGKQGGGKQKGGAKPQRREDPDNAAPSQSVRELNRLVKRAKQLRVTKITRRLKDAKKEKVIATMNAQLEASKQFDIHATVQELVESIGAVIPPKVGQEWARAVKNELAQIKKQIGDSSIPIVEISEEVVASERDALHADLAGSPQVGSILETIARVTEAMVAHKQSERKQAKKVVPCSIEECKAKFASDEALKTHLIRRHANVPAVRNMILQAQREKVELENEKKKKDGTTTTTTTTTTASSKPSGEVNAEGERQPSQEEEEKGDVAVEVDRNHPMWIDDTWDDLNDMDEDDQEDGPKRKNRLGQRRRKRAAIMQEVADRKKARDAGVDLGPFGQLAKARAKKKAGDEGGASSADAGVGGKSGTRGGKSVGVSEKEEDAGPLHPSWEAKRRAKEMEDVPVKFEGKRMKFADSDDEE